VPTDDDGQSSVVCDGGASSLAVTGNAGPSQLPVNERKPSRMAKYMMVTENDFWKSFSSENIFVI
jgi:hypothetical protein